MLFVPDQPLSPLLPVQDVAVELGYHLRVVLSSKSIFSSSARRSTLMLLSVCIVTCLESVTVCPLLPMQDILKVVFTVKLLIVVLKVVFGFFEPVHCELNGELFAVHELTLLELMVSCVEPPDGTVCGLALKDTEGLPRALAQIDPFQEVPEAQDAVATSVSRLV